MNVAVLGAQWGDEGKGKIVDLLTPHFSTVARYQGGHNAGHTVYVRGKKFVRLRNKIARATRCGLIAKYQYDGAPTVGFVAPIGGGARSRTPRRSSTPSSTSSCACRN